MVKSLLYVCDKTKSPSGVASSIRIPAAANAAMTKKMMMVNRYSSAIRL